MRSTISLWPYEVGLGHRETARLYKKFLDTLRGDVYCLDNIDLWAEYLRMKTVFFGEYGYLPMGEYGTFGVATDSGVYKMKVSSSQPHHFNLSVEENYLEDTRVVDYVLYETDDTWIFNYA